MDAASVTFDTRMMQDLAAAQLSYNDHVAALQEFRVACQDGNWPRAEAARLRVVATQEAYLDSMTAAHRRLADELRRGA